MRIAADTADRRSETVATILLGDLAVLTGKSAAAIRLYQQARRQAEQANLRYPLSAIRYPLAQALVALAKALRDGGQPMRARHHALRAQQVAVECGFASVLEQAYEVLRTDR